jgi:hypothetical protein
MGQGDPGRQHQARMKQHPGEIFHNARSANSRDEVIDMKGREFVAAFW